jgi:hypothetical protein
LRSRFEEGRAGLGGGSGSTQHAKQGQSYGVEIVRFSAAGGGKRRIGGHGTAFNDWQNSQGQIVAKGQDYDAKG